MKSTKTFLHAKELCIEEVKKNFISDSYLEFKDIELYAESNICLEIFQNDEIKKIIDEKTYQVFEAHYKHLNEYILNESQKYLDQCTQSSYLKYTSCVNQNWDHVVSYLFDKWVEKPQNKHFKNHKKLFINRLNGLNHEFINREIASEE